MSDLIISVSGLRGKVGSGLTAMLATEYASAYGTFLGGGKVIVGRDSRPSGAMLAQAVMAGLASAGCNPLDIGLAATPTCGLLVKQLGTAGGVEISASHNPSEWNGMKLFHRDGRVLNGSEAEEVKSIFESKKFAVCRWDEVGRPSRYGDPHAAHLTRVLAVVDAEAIRRRSFHVVLDSNHGVGGILGSRLLSALGCRVTALGGTPDGAFDHPPEPLPENLIAVCRAVRDSQAHIGFAQDPDADRLAIVDETGRAIGEELTITLAAHHFLAKRPGLVVVNLSTTRAVEDAAAARGSKCERTAVGEANVVERMLKKNAVLGGEGNGGVILPQVVHVRDSFSGMALILEAMALHEAPVSLLVRRLPQYFMIKDKVEVDPAKLPAVLRKLSTRQKDASPNLADGLRLDWPDRWLHVRASNTEPIARIIAEAKTEPAARELIAQARGMLGVAIVKPRTTKAKSGVKRARPVRPAKRPSRGKAAKAKR
ncbi:MAG: phosphoglucosamine mutase [Planctomycetes bacterium]|nr:phosphoglucosamine mutase [Planctomycetota bacterium]